MTPAERYEVLAERGVGAIAAANLLETAAEFEMCSAGITKWIKWYFTNAIV